MFYRVTELDELSRQNLDEAGTTLQLSDISTVDVNDYQEALKPSFEAALFPN
jgi:hypothetical protein